METLTRNYETVFITGPNATESSLDEINKRNQQIIESFKGKVLHLDDWGKRKLAYPINKENKGHYFCVTYKADNKTVAELERNLRINENIVRFLTVKIDEKVDPMAAIESYKRRLEAHAKREKERAERDAERQAERASFRQDRGPREERGPRPPRMAEAAPVGSADTETEGTEE